MVIIWVKKWMGVSREGCSLSNLMTLAALQPVLQERKQPQDEISCSLASAQNWNVDREVRAHPKTSWLNCRCCAKPSGKTKTPWALKPVLVAAGRTDVKSVCYPKATGCERAGLYFHCRLEPFSENHNLFDLKRTSQNNFPSGICFFFPEIFAFK